MRPQLHSLFPTPIFQSQIPLEDLWLENIKNLMYDRTVGDNGYISRDRDIFKHPDLHNLKDKIEEQIKFFAYEYLKVQRYVDIEVCRSWGVKHLHTDWAQKHCHSNSVFSGIYYLDVDEYSGDLLIDKGQHATNCFIPTLTPDVTHYNKYTQQNWRLKPENGMLVAFPSQIIHSVEPNRSPKLERYAIAFDVFIRGQFGYGGGSDVTIK
jgi:uncharacterized protein (TIGR02466 family)|tara:strand:- start:20 stop:646 length:627 start_codon:yes stop_codon:yes gene_type:complete